MSARYIVGDVFDVLATLEDNSVDLIFSSPPFLALRSYLPADHESKHLEIGSEATPADFLDTLLDVVEACDRVLAPHGSLCFELGDTFSGSGGAGGDWIEGSGQRVYKRGDDIPDFSTMQKRKGDGWPLDKSLCGIPTLFAWSLAYGRNLLRPERETPRWRIRNLVVWARPNPPVGALGDKFRPATSYLTVATKARDRYFDLDAVRSASVNPIGVGVRPTMARVNGSDEGDSRDTLGPYTAEMQSAGAPPLDYWVIPTQPYKGSHYATFPEALCVKPIAAMSPQRVCRVCGEPSRRIVDLAPGEGGVHPGNDGGGPTGYGKGHRSKRTVLAEEWSDCGHDDYRVGVVLDTFAGSGTTLAVATGHGRDAIGIDLDERNADLALERVGPMLLTVEYLNREGVA